MIARSPLPIDTAALESWRRRWPVILVPLILACWAHALAFVDVEAMSDLGLLSVLPLTFYASVLLLTVSFSFFVTRSSASETLLVLHVGLLIILLYTPPMLIYETLRLPWAWKHLGIVDYILREGGIEPRIAAMPAYHNWPGFFVLIAFVAELAGPERLLPIARWSPLVGHVAVFGMLAFVFRSLIDHRPTIWMAIWIYYLANWVGQDYFAPQAFVFPIYLGLIGLVLAFFKASPPPHPEIGQASLIGSWYQLIDGAVRTEPKARSAETHRWFAGALLILLLALTVSHQLTPAVIIFAFGLLYVFRRLHSLWPLVAVICFYAIWLIGPAGGFIATEIYSLTELAGDAFGNAAANLHDLQELSRSQAIVAITSRALTVAVLVLAFVGGLLRLYKGYFDVSAALLSLAPFLILLIHSYDGEGLFRSYLFATPFLAFFASCLLNQIVTRFSRPFGVTFLSVVLALLALGWLTAYYGNDNHTRTLPGESEAFAFLAETAPDHALLIEGSPDYPSRFSNYERFTYVSIIDEPKDSLDLILADAEAELGRWLDNERYAAGYILLTASQKKGIEAFGRLPVGSFDRIEMILRQSDRFDIAFENEAAIVFVLSAGHRTR